MDMRVRNEHVHTRNIPSSSSDKPTCLLPWCAALLVTLFLALTALQFVISTNLPNSR